MKVLDPQSALLTTAEVHHFLATNPARPADQAVGGYPTVDLRGYHNVREDFERHVQKTSPHVLTYKPPEKWMRPVLSLLKGLGLTKTEALMVINLGVGLNPQAQKANGSRDPENEDKVEADAPAESNGTVKNGDEGDEAPESVAAEPEVERDDSLLLSAIIEEIDTRLSEQQQQEILSILREYAVGCEAAEEDGLADETAETTVC